MARRVVKQSAKGALKSTSSPENVFGAQSRWSSLLVERERLESEIKHAQMLLEQLRKDVFGPKPISSAKPVRGRKGGGDNRSGIVRSALDKHTLEQSVLMWLDGLYAMLGHITAEAEKLLAEGEQEPESAEESLFTLLRGAG